MVFTNYSTRIELQNSLHIIEKSEYPEQLLTISESIKAELLFGFNYAPLRLYSYEKHNTLYWFAQRNHDVTRKLTYIAVQGVVVLDDLAEGFRVFNEKEKLTDGAQRKMIVTGLPVAEKIVALIKELGGNDYLTWKRDYRFYMSEEQRNIIKSLELSIPSEYELGSLETNDAKEVLSMWLSEDNAVEQIRRKIERFPSSCLRLNGKIVAFEVSDPAGQLNNQFTAVEHRGKGLGNLIELDLSKKLISNGLSVYKHVNYRNDAVLASSTRSMYFTRLLYKQGDDIIVSYICF